MQVNVLFVSATIIRNASMFSLGLQLIKVIELSFNGNDAHSPQVFLTSRLAIDASQACRRSITRLYLHSIL